MVTRIENKEVSGEIDQEAIEAERLMQKIREASQSEANLREFALQQVREKKQLEKTAADRLEIINRAYRDHLNQEVLSPIAFPERLLASIRAARATGGILAIVAADLDNFKGYNDKEGHPAGDKILSDAGDAFKEVENAVVNPEALVFAANQAIEEAGQRKTDAVSQTNISDLIEDLSVDPTKPTITRKGGDEFVAIWPGTVNGLLVAARAQRFFSEKQTKTEAANGRPMVKVGMTMGIRLLDFSSEIFNPDDRVVAKMALQDADDALYVAKQTQKGSVFEFNPQDPRIQNRQAARKTG